MAILITGSVIFLLGCSFLVVSVIRWGNLPKSLKDDYGNSQDKIFSTLEEESFKYRTIYWQETCIDCTGFALDCKSLISEIKELQTKSEAVDLFFHKPLMNFGLKNAKAIIMGNFYDPMTGVFRQCEDSPADVAAINDAIRIIFWYTDPTEAGNGFYGGVERELGTVFQKCFNFINDSQDPETGLFKSSPYMGEPSIANTFSCFLSIHELRELDKNEKDEKRYYFMHRDAIFKEISENCYNNGGFSNTKYGPRLICATYYAMRILRCLQDEKDDIFNFLDGNAVLDFVGKCWDDKAGGYNSGALPSQIPNIVHTRYALTVLRSLLYNKLVDEGDLAAKIEPDRIMSFVNSHWQNGGYSTVRGVAPHLYSVRAALHIAKLLRVFELNGIFGSRHRCQDYLKEYDKFLARIDETETFVESCREERKNSYACFPIN